MAVIKVRNGDTWDSITTIKGDTGPQGPKGDKGEKGDKGDNAQLTGNLTIVQNQSTIESKGKTTFTGTTAKTVNIDEPVLVTITKTTAANSTLSGELPNVSALYNGLMIKMFIPVITTKSELKFALKLADGTTVTKDVYKNGVTKLSANDVPEASYMTFVYSTDYAVDGTTYEGWRLIGSAAQGNSGAIFTIGTLAVETIDDVISIVCTTSTTSISKLENGISLNVFFESSVGNFPLYLKLTLKDDTITEAIPVYTYNESNASARSEIEANSIGQLFYFDGNNAFVPGWYLLDKPTKANGQLYGGKISVLAANTTDLLGYVDGSGYTPLEAGLAFNTSFPILYYADTTSISAPAEIENVYMSYTKAYASSRLGMLGAGGLIMYEPLYLKGKYSGVTFTIDNTQPFIQTLPTESDGYQYLLLGMAAQDSYYCLYPNHEVYWRANGVISRFNNVSYIASTEDIGEGAELPSGVLYLVYEE